MSTYSPNVQSKSTPPSNESSVNTTATTNNSQIDDFDSISVRPLIELLLRWWREITLITLAIAALGIGFIAFQRMQEDPVYEASAQVAITRITSNFVLGTNFETAIDNDMRNAADSSARRNSLLGLVKNGTIAQAVIDDLGPMVEGITASALQRKVKAAFDGANDSSDLIAINVRDKLPEVAAAIANAWANHYVAHINVLYGEMPAEMTDLVGTELEKTRVNYELAQQTYEEFLRQNDVPSLNRQMGEMQELIDTLQATRQIAMHSLISRTVSARQTLIETYHGTLLENQILAMTSEQDANRELLQTLITVIGENRQLAITTEQAARQQLFTAYAERELQNRLLALQQEQDAKTAVFNAYSDADLRAKLEVFNQQVEQKLGGLVDAYTEQRRIERILADAAALQAQIEATGDAGARSNGLPLLLLKLDAFAATTSPSQGMTDLLRLDLGGAGTLEIDAADQAADIAALIENLNTRAAALRQEIETRSLTLYNNEGYALLDEVRPEDDALYAAIQEQYLDLFEVDALGEVGDAVGGDNVLAQAILAKYDELFGVGTLATAGLAISDTTPIHVALRAQYPALFTAGDLDELGELLDAGNLLDSASYAKLAELLQPAMDIEAYLAALQSTSAPILQLETNLRALQADLESKRAQEERLARERDIALEAYTALNNKRLELSLQRTVAGREVGLASVAVPPDRPIETADIRVIAVILVMGGFMLAIAIVALANLMDVPPFLSRGRPAPVMPANQTSP